MIPFDCQRCGKCCQGDSWLRKIINPTDVKKWKKMRRDDILRFVCLTCYRLVDPDNSCKPWIKENCPFLTFEDNIASCKIYDVRPEVCKEFPIVKCSNSKCDLKYHLHRFFWTGKCKTFKIMKKAIESEIESLVKK